MSQGDVEEGSDIFQSLLLACLDGHTVHIPVVSHAAHNNAHLHISTLQLGLLNDQVWLQMLSREQPADVFQGQQCNSSKHQHTQALPCLRPTVHEFMTLYVHQKQTMCKDQVQASTDQ